MDPPPDEGAEAGGPSVVEQQVAPYWLPHPNERQSGEADYDNGHDAADDDDDVDAAGLPSMDREDELPSHPAHPVGVPVGVRNEQWPGAPSPPPIIPSQESHQEYVQQQQQEQAPVNGQPSPGTKEVSDFEVLREHWDEEANRKTPSGIVPSTFDAPPATAAPSRANLIPAFRDGGSFDSEEGKVGEHTVGDDTSSTDNLSGISDPIAGLTQSPRKSFESAREEGSPRVSEVPCSQPIGPLDSRSIPEEGRDTHTSDASAALTGQEKDDTPDANATCTGEEKDDGRGTAKEEARRSSSTDPVENNPEATAAANFADSGVFFKDVKQYWEDGATSNQSPAGASPASANLFSEEFRGIIHPDADRVIMLEDTDMRPCIAEPELDGEPVFLYDGDSYDDDDDDDEAHHGNAVHEKSPRGRARELGDGPTKIPMPLQEEASVDTTHVAEPFSEARREELMKPITSKPLDLPSDASPLPDATPVLATGSIRTRSSIRSLVMKKWHSNHWVRYGPTSLYIFRSEDDFLDWLQNPYHAQKQRDYLIKLRLDFYNEMKKPTTRGFRMTDIKVKAYEKKGVPMYNFKLERWSDLGVSIAAAFGSPDVEEVKAVHAAISHCLEMCPNAGLKPIDDLLVQQQT